MNILFDKEHPVARDNQSEKKMQSNLSGNAPENDGDDTRRKENSLCKQPIKSHSPRSQSMSSNFMGGFGDSKDSFGNIFDETVKPLIVIESNFIKENHNSTISATTTTHQEKNNSRGVASDASSSKSTPGRRAPIVNIGPEQRIIQPFQVGPITC
ncbi:unnamed protein product [Oikopleura dioica]|uniref:Uncharacterized protein n=1 Tax=Oikopleura dioica TaxID=34765 RepID=E4XS56_OIKDI|nr:unnamed protein product [Oikopleura dioica]